MPGSSKVIQKEKIPKRTVIKKLHYFGSSENSCNIFKCETDGEKFSPHFGADFFEKKQWCLRKYS